MTTKKTAATVATATAQPTGLAGLAAQARARRAQLAQKPAAQATGMITDPAKEERKVPDFWVNVGYEMPDPETGENVFISLPVGINIDDLQPRKLNATDPRINQINAARNHLLRVLQEDAANMEAGTSVILDFLQVQLLRRTQEGKGVLDTNANPFILEELKYEEEQV